MSTGRPKRQNFRSGQKSWPEMTGKWQFVTFIKTDHKLIIVTLISVSELVQPASLRGWYLLEAALCAAFFMARDQTDTPARDNKDTSSPWRRVRVLRNMLLRWYLTVSRDRPEL